MYWRPDPIGPPTPNRNAGSICASARRLAQHNARTQSHNPQTGTLGQSCGRFPVLAQLRKKICAARRRLAENLTATIAVVADRAPGNQRLRTGLCFRNRSYQLLGQLHPALDKRSARVSVQRPPMIASPARFTTASLRSRACLRP